MDNDAARRIGLLAVAAALAAGLGVTGRRLATRRRQRPETFTCACGATYRVSGADRHRVYWPAGAPQNAPVLGDACVSCGAALPSGHDLTVV